MKRKSLKGSWILAFLFCMSVFTSTFNGVASAIDSNKLIFSWQQAAITQSISNIDISNKTSITFSVSAAEVQDWKTSSDNLNIAINLYGSGGGLIYSHSTGDMSIDSNSFSNYSLTINSSEVSGWSQISSVSVSIIGNDGEFWAGNYGTQVESASLKFNDNIELLSNPEFANGINGWTSSTGWQDCSGGAGSQPCVSNPPTATSIVVTSLQDTSDQGTLRWAIGQANATAGGIFDTITFSPSLSGTITLTSALPAISQNLTITGNGSTNTIIDRKCFV